MTENLTYDLIKALRQNNEKEIDKIIYQNRFHELIDIELIIQYFDELFKNKSKYIKFVLHYIINESSIKSKKLLKKLNFPRSYYHLMIKYDNNHKFNYYKKKFLNSNKNIDIIPPSDKKNLYICLRYDDIHKYLIKYYGPKKLIKFILYI